MLDPLRWPKFFATLNHGEQLYGGNLPYTHHLSKVEEVARRFKDDILRGLGLVDDSGLRHCTMEELADELDIFLSATWLHDVVEDTRKKPEPVKRKHIAELFGENVAGLVDAVTDEPGENRKARKAATYPKIREYPGAVALKLCDRIANVEHGGDLVKMYRKEHEDFRRNLYTPGEYEALWAHLNELLK